MNVDYVKNDISNLWEDELAKVSEVEREPITHELAIKIVSHVEMYVREGYSLADAYMKAKSALIISLDESTENQSRNVFPLHSILHEGGVF